MKNLELEKKILSKIRKIKPKSKFYFILFDVFFWFCVSIFLVFSSLSFSVILNKFFIEDNYFFSNFLLENNFNYLLEFLPLFWIFSSILFILLIILNFSKTKKFYQITTQRILLIIIFLSLFFGSFFFFLGLSEKTESTALSLIPFYDRYLKVRDIRKEIFKDKLLEMGLSKEILDSMPDLKKKVNFKFQENVLGKRYIKTFKQCKLKDVKCLDSEIYFEDEFGCGCRSLFK